MVGALTQLAEVTGTCTVNGKIVDCSEATQLVTGAVTGMLIMVWLMAAVVGLITVVSMWKLFTKANKPGWAAIVPIYNTIVQLQIVGRPLWWILLFLIPFVNIIFAIILMFDTAKAYGKDAIYGLLLLFVPIVGYPILAFGKAKYVGPVAAGGQDKPAPPTDTPSTPSVAQPPVQPPASPGTPQ